MGENQTLLHTLSTVHIPFSAPHLSLTIMLTRAGSWFLLCKRCHWELYVMHQHLYSFSVEILQKKGAKPQFYGFLCLPFLLSAQPIKLHNVMRHFRKVERKNHNDADNDADLFWRNLLICH